MKGAHKGRRNTLLSSLDKDGDSQITFYGKYVPETTKVYVYADARDLVNDPDSQNYIETVLGFEIVGGYFPLGVLNNVNLRAATSYAVGKLGSQPQIGEVQNAARTEINFTFPNDTQNILRLNKIKPVNGLLIMLTTPV